MPDLITSDEVADHITYDVPGSTAFILLAASAVFDGSALNSVFVPSIEILAPDNRQLFEFGQDLLVVQHGEPLVTFAPHLSPATPGVASSDACLQTGMPALEYEAHYKIVFMGKAPNSSGGDPAISVSDMSMLVEVTRGGAGLGYGPFELVTPKMLHKA